MGVEPNWGLLGNAPNIGQSFQQGMAMGRQQAIQQRSDNALAQVQKNPDDTNALGTLAIYNPPAAQAVIQSREMQKQAQRRAALISSVDPSTGLPDHVKAAQKLAATDPEGAQAILQQGQAAQVSRLEFQHKVTSNFLQNLDAGDLADDTHYKALLARTAPQWKAAGLPVPTWLPQSVEGLTSDQKGELFDSLQAHALDVAGQIKQRLPDQKQFGNFIFEDGKPKYRLPPTSPYMPVAGMGVLPNPAAVNPQTGQLYGLTEIGASGGAGPPGAATPASAAGDASPAAPISIPPGGNARGIRNNNPLNLTLSPWTQHQAGFAGTDPGGRYAKFQTPEQGMAAAVNLLHNYQARGLKTPAAIVGRWAPAAENGASTTNYANYVAKRLGIGPNDPVSPEMFPKMAWAMYEFENGLRPRAPIPREVGAQDYVAHATPGAPEATSTLNGKTYVRINGKWFDAAQQQAASQPAAEDGGDE